jgi:hypothetical protein
MLASPTFVIETASAAAPPPAAPLLIEALKDQFLPIASKPGGSLNCACRLLVGERSPVLSMVLVLVAASIFYTLISVCCWTLALVSVETRRP